MSLLLDGNVLTALVIDTHLDHHRVRSWFATISEPFATCSVTQGTLLRLHMRLALDNSPSAAWAALAGVEAHPRHEYWREGLPYRSVRFEQLTGHRQVTDAWLAELARRHGGTLVTLDHGLSKTHSDVSLLI